MSMIEKLFVGIFERKSSIIDRVDQQARLFDQHLASKLLIDGITPPQWLLNSDLRSRTSHHSELTELPNGLCTEMRAQNKDFDGREKTSALAPNLVNDSRLGCLEGQRDEDPSIMSPQDQRDTRTSDVNHDVALSLARLQRSRSRQKALEIRRSAKKVNCQLDNEANHSGCSGRVSGFVVPSLQNYHLEESNFAKPFDAHNEDWVVEGAKIGGVDRKQNSSRTDSGRITRSKSDAQRPSSYNVADSSNATSKDDALADTVVFSFQRSSHENPPLELVSGSQVGEPDAEVGGKRKKATWSSTNDGRITRSRKVSRGDSSIESVPEVLHFNDNDKILSKSILPTSYRCHSSNGTQNVIRRSTDNRRTTRSRSKVSQDTSNMGPVLEIVHSNNNMQIVTGSVFTTSTRSHGDKEIQIKDEQSSSIREDDRICAANSTDSSDKENVAGEYVGINIREDPSSTFEVTSNSFNSQGLGCRVTRSISAASCNHLENISLYNVEAIGSKEVSFVEVKDPPCIGTSEPENLDKSFSVLKEAEADPGGPVEAHSVCSRSQLSDASVAEDEVLAPFPAQISTPVEPRQLNFDEVEPSSFNDISSPALENELEDELSQEKEPLALPEFAGTDDKVMSENYLENDSLHPEEGNDFSMEKESTMVFFETNLKDIDAASVASDEHIESLAKEKSIKNNMVTQNSQNSKKCTKEMSSLMGHFVTSQVACGSSPKTLLKQVTCSDFSDANAGTVMNLNSRAETETPVAVLPAEFAPKDGGPETFSSADKDVDFSLVNRPDHFGDQQTCTDIDLPCAVSKDETMLNADQEIKDMNTSQYHIAESLERSAHDNTTIDCTELSQGHELQTEEVGYTLDLRNSSSNTPFTFTYEELETSLVQSVVRQGVGDCQLHFMVEARDTDPTSSVTDGNWHHSFDDGNAYLLEGKFGIADPESLTGTKTLIQEKNSDLADETMPDLEGFNFQSDDEQPCIVDEEIKVDDLNLPKTMIERASILEKLCKSACMQTPVSYSSTASYKSSKVSNLYQSVPTGLLEGMDVRIKHPVSEAFSRAFQGRSCSDSIQNSAGGRDWDTKKPCLSPVQKVWERILSKSASSEKRKSLSLELPCINEESENIEEVADISQAMDLDMMGCSGKREALAGIDENLPVSEAEPFADRFSLDSVATEFSFNGTHNRTNNNRENARSVKRRYNNNKENANPSLGASSRKGIVRPLQNRFSKQKLSANTISRKGGPGSTEIEPKRGNIVSNITSFIPLVQQKQAPTIATGKRDVKVKALGAAEAAKRLAEKKENERRIKKEAMKLERARVEQENLKQLELQRKRKEEERKKKEANMAEKKRQREEEEKREKERKRLRVEEKQKQQKENEQRLQAAKEEKEKSRIMEERGREANEWKDAKGNPSKIEKVKADENIPRITEPEPTNTQASTSDDKKEVAIQEEFEASSDLANKWKVNELGKPTATQNLVAISSQEPSYDISPYKCSDEEDEDDEEDDDNDRPKKFVPSWASKKGLASVLLSQDSQSPWEIFPPNSFCSISEVVLPRRFQIKL